MADRGDTHYFTPNLNRWFLISSLLLLVTTAWMVIDDYNAGWKTYQREFRTLELERAEAELASASAQAVVANEERATEELQRATDQLAAKEAEIEEVEAELTQLRANLFVSLEAAKSAKQEFNWERYLIEEERLHEEDPGLGAERLAGYEQRMIDAAYLQQLDEIALAEAEDRMDGLMTAVSEAESRLKLAGKAIELTRAKKDALAPEDLPRQIANAIRDDIPGLDFIGPNIKVNKVVLDDLTFELNFTRKKRIDMCMTCHMAADRAGFEEEDGLEHPFLSHPRLDLYLTAKSPHPLTEVGCTICHRGSGEALDFQRVDHNVSRVLEPEKAEQWEEDYHWHKQHYWDYPMLTSDKVEASCVQCHKTSMELIAEDAPEVSKGYRLFERYGCYACHKVDWFPTKRKPGPSLLNVFAKTNPDWVASWIADPRGYRPSTWMPQIFHLENFEEDEEVVTSNYGSGRPILGGEWNESAIAAVTAFLANRAPIEPLDPVPVAGDAQRGRESFRLSGCVACHNMEGWEGEEPETVDLAFDPNRYNVHGPNLRGVATKLKSDWLYWWLKDPAAMWPETRMPNLRLSDQDAADITAYLMEDPDGVFTDTPDAWQVTEAEYDMDVLAEQARWYFSRTSRDQLEKRFAGEDPAFRWDRDDELLVAVGEKFVQQYGCYSCHSIEGYESAMPIGAELTNWASKTVDKLDWALLANIMQEEHGWDQHRRTEEKSYRENWLRQKLHEPRSYDRQKVKTPTEKLKMPWFDFDADEVEAIVTFVVGLVDDEVKRAKMVPDAAELARNTGLQAIRQQNCVACHMIEPGTVTFLDEDGHEHTVKAELLSMDAFLDAWTHPMPPQTSLADFEEFVANYEESLGEDVEEVGIRLLGPEPGIGVTGENVFIERDQLVAMAPAWGGDFVDLVTNYYYYGVEQFDPEAPEEDAYYNVWGSDDPDAWGLVADADGQSRDYTGEPYDKARWTFAPPVLWDEGGKLQKEWFYSFLKGPFPLRQQMRVKMPTFNFPEGHAGAVAAYFASQSEIDWPVEYARELRLSGGWTVDELAAATGLSVVTIEGIEAGSAPDIAANFSKLKTWGDAQGFTWFDGVDAEFEDVERRSPAYLDRMYAAHADYLQQGDRLARQGPQCFQCHFDRETPPNADPIAWAPDLSVTRERLREDWVVEWLANPGRVYPGTAMPANFASDPPQYQELFPDSSNEDQIRAVTDWLYNYDRIPPGN